MWLNRRHHGYQIPTLPSPKPAVAFPMHTCIATPSTGIVWTSKSLNCDAVHSQSRILHAWALG
eukprot:14666046-Alexandrium_andersonii.AAC.1